MKKLYLCSRKLKVKQLNNKNMAKYKISLESEIRVEMGYCVTQVCNKLGDDVCTILTLTQVSERIG